MKNFNGKKNSLEDYLLQLAAATTFVAVHQSFPIACTSSSSPWKNTLTIRLQPVEFDWMRDDEDDDDDEGLLPDGSDDALDDSPVVVVEYFKVDGPEDGDDLESFESAFEVLEVLGEKKEKFDHKC